MCKNKIQILSIRLIIILTLFSSPVLSQEPAQDILSLKGVLWTFESDSSIHGSPALADSMLYIGSNDQHLYALDACNGKEIWKTDVKLNIFGQAATGDQLAYVGCLDGKVYCIY